MVRAHVAYLDLDLDAAEADLRTAIEKEPGLAEAYRNLASIVAARLRNDEAIRLYQRAVQLDPLSIRSRMNLAVGYYLLRGDEDAALKELNYILDLEPDNEDALYWAGGASVTSGRPREGIALLEPGRSTPTIPTSIRSSPGPTRAWDAMTKQGRSSLWCRRRAAISSRRSRSSTASSAIRTARSPT